VIARPTGQTSIRSSTMSNGQRACRQLRLLTTCRLNRGYRSVGASAIRFI
jgi:hypothetical protein